MSLLLLTNLSNCAQRLSSLRFTSTGLCWKSLHGFPEAMLSRFQSFRPLSWNVLGAGSQQWLAKSRPPVDNFHAALFIFTIINKIIFLPRLTISVFLLYRGPCFPGFSWSSGRTDCIGNLLHPIITGKIQALYPLLPILGYLTPLFLVRPAMIMIFLLLCLYENTNRLPSKVRSHFLI